MFAVAIRARRSLTRSAPEYAVSHIPGAIFVDYEHDFVDVADPVPYQIASPQAFAERAAELGINTGDLIVTYDDYYGIFAARVAWAFRFHGAEARVLDGGWRTWVDENRPISADAVEPPVGDFTPKVRSALKRDLVEVAAASCSRRDSGRCASSPPLHRRARSRGERAHSGRRFAAIPGAGRRRDRVVRDAGRDRASPARRRHRPRTSAARGDRHVRHGRLGNRRVDRTRACRDSRSGRLRRLVLGMERQLLAADRVRNSRLTNIAQHRPRAEVINNP